MKIVLFHPVLLPPRDYGGVERVVLWLAEALLDLGHEVHIAALEGSRLPPGAHLISIGPNELSALKFLKRIPEGTDVVHFMAPPEAGTWEALPCAGILTIHGNGKPGEQFPKNTVFLTRDHAERHGRQVFVWNGINPNEYVFRESLDHASPLFLSKTSWKVKNLSGAIRFCTKAKQKLKIAGGNRPYSTRIQAWFLGHDWQGPVSGERKAELLAGASALVFPIKWPEPFGLVMIEAMVSGTPVVASAIGSVPEVVGDCGILMKSLEDESGWVRALEDVKKVSRRKCRDRVLENFTHHHMAKSYLKLYRQVIEGKELSL